MKPFILATLIISLSLNGFFVIRSFLAPDPVNSPLLKPETPNSLSAFPYLSQRIFVEKPNDLLINFIPLRTALEQYVTSLPDEGEIGIYFEYLPSGVSIGVNEAFEVRLASLVKTPLVMGIYKEIEKGKISEDTVLTLQEEHLDPKFGDLWKRGAGTTLTVKEAIDLALIKSDNTAANALASILPPKALDEVFDNLDIETTTEGTTNLITPESYSSIFRSLYLSSTVSQESSNKILDILTRTDFNQQIAAGVPENIPVAHKIGIYASENSRSDCGIVYVPKRPYLLCIITKADEEESRAYMSHISKMIYSYIAIAQAK